MSASTVPATAMNVIASTRAVRVGLTGLIVSIVVSVDSPPLYMFRPMTAIRPGHEHSSTM